MGRSAISHAPELSSEHVSRSSIYLPLTVLARLLLRCYHSYARYWHALFYPCLEYVMSLSTTLSSSSSRWGPPSCFGDSAGQLSDHEHAEADIIALTSSGHISKTLRLTVYDHLQMIR
jgi:hypothetical protein